ncbi:MAG: Eco57I restriction-modification methylase domain-containing protein [Pseudonocardiaceae bacterium]
MITASTIARDLGPRGSRAALAGPDPAGDLPESARAVLAAVPAWWAARAAAAELSGSWLDVGRALAAPLPEGVHGTEPDESVSVTASAHDVGSAYVAALSPQVRARHGRHYTPRTLADELWTMTRRALGLRRGSVQRLPGLIHDPACGAGALLLPPLREHVAAVRGIDPQVAIAGLPHVIGGVDTDPAAVWLANVLTAAEALPLLAAVPARHRRPFPTLIRLGDGLQHNELGAAAIVMNPPYGRVRLTPDDRARFAPTLYGHANLYGLFLAAALENLDERGVIAAVVPTSFTSGLYFRNLRAALATTAPLTEVAFVVDRGGVFAGVLQETCLAVFSRRQARRTTIASLHGMRTNVARVRSPRGDGPWLLPRRSDDAPLAAAAVTMPLNLTAAGWRVSTGPLVWNRRSRDLHPEPGPNRVPVLWAADLDGGHLHRDRVRDHLRYLELRVPNDRAVMMLTEPAVLVQRTTAPEQSRRLVATDLTSDVLRAWGGAVVVENHVNVVRPATATPPLLSQATLNRVLATRTLDRVMRCMSGSVAVSAYELESLPLPSAGVLQDWNSLTGTALEAAVASAYRPEPA